MGSACCVAAKEKKKNVSNQLKTGSTVRIMRYLPSRSFGTANQSNVESRVNSRFSAGNHRNDGLEGRRGRVGSLIESSPKKPNFPQNRITKNFGSGNSDPSSNSALSIEGKDSIKIRTPSNQSTCASSPASIPSISKTVPLNSQIPFKSPNTVKQTSCLSGCQRSNQSSENQVSTFRSPNDAIVSEGRNSFTSSLASGGSFSESSDDWSIRTFSELVASQRDRWSFESESTVSTHGIVSRSNSSILTSPAQLQVCGICSKLLMEMSVLDYASGSQLPVVSILFCEHVFHAECLERITTETNKFDPTCPVCTVGEKPASESKVRNKLSRIGVADGEFENDILMSNEMKGRKGGFKLGASSSIKKPFSEFFIEKAISQWKG